MHRQSGFATCCAALIQPDGEAVIANAGHPAPYCDGNELVLEGGLPLGIAAWVMGNGDLAAMQRGLAVRRERLGAAARHLDALSPLSVLVRGYAIVTRDGAPVDTASALTPGDLVRLRLAHGEADARVEAVRP